MKWDKRDIVERCAQIAIYLFYGTMIVAILGFALFVLLLKWGVIN